VQNGLSCLDKKTRPTLCLKGSQARLGINSLGTNKVSCYKEYKAFGPSQIYNSIIAEVEDANLHGNEIYFFLDGLLYP